MEKPREDPLKRPVQQPSRAVLPPVGGQAAEWVPLGESGGQIITAATAQTIRQARPAQMGARLARRFTSLFMRRGLPFSTITPRLFK